MSALGQKPTNHPGQKPTNVRYCPEADIEYGDVLNGTGRVRLISLDPSTRLRTHHSMTPFGDSHRYCGRSRVTPENNCLIEFGIVAVLQLASPI